MLQQTQVATVIPYFERFLAAFPDLAALAAGPEEEVLRLWAGLGYYRRARDLHRAARLLAEHHGGRLPDDPDLLADLPGMGRYTRNAVLSQAFDRRLPILEANSRRVLARLFARTDDPRSSAAERWLWQKAEELLPTRRAGDFNQALMELGALVCTPAAPRCDACPLTDDCAAFRQGLQDRIPPRPARPEVSEVQEVAVVLRRDAEVLLVQRPSRGRWAGFWEFPHGERTDGESAPDAAFRLLQEATGLQAELGAELITIRHGVTRFRITMVCFEARHHSGEFRPGPYPEARWVRPDRLGDFALSSPQRRLARAAVAGVPPSLFPPA